MWITKNNIDRFIDIDRKTMDCVGRGITKIEYIPDGITHLFCDRNRLTELPKLPDSLLYLYCYNNKLTELPILPESLEYLSCRNNNLPYKVNILNLKEHNKLIKRKQILEKIRLYH